MTGLRENIRQQAQQILAVLQKHSGELSVGQIADLLETEFALKLEPHAVAYRIRQLSSGAVIAIGDGKGRRYRAATSSAIPVAHTQTKQVGQTTSQDAAAVLAMLAKPAEERPWVGYDHEWLYAYVPGETYYLPQAVRSHLATIGRSPVAGRPAGTFARDIYERLLVDLSWASSRLEGNTYSRLDTELLLEFGQRADGKDATEAQMILNHKAAIDLLVSLGPELRVSEQLLRGLHARLAENLMRHKAHEGQLRRGEVGITNSKYYPTAVPQLITDCFARIASTAAAIPDPFEQSFFLLVHLPYLQPFNDVNKRTSRLAANIPLIAGNLCPLTFVDVPPQRYAAAILSVYELKRTEPLREVFVQAYEQSCALYIVAQEAVTPPNPLRLKYRDALRTAVADVVRGGLAPSSRWSEQWAAQHGIPRSDHTAFAELLVELLLALNDASASREGLSPSEFFAWREKFRPA